MGLLDNLKLSIEMTLPQSATRALGRILGSGKAPATATVTARVPSPRGSRYKRLIELIDIKLHGGLTFGPESLERMATVLADIIESPPNQAQPDLEEIAKAILDVAVDGERNPARLRELAVSRLSQKEKVVETTDNIPVEKSTI